MSPRYSLELQRQGSYPARRRMIITNLIHTPPPRVPVRPTFLRGAVPLDAARRVRNVALMFKYAEKCRQNWEKGAHSFFGVKFSVLVVSKFVKVIQAA